MDWLSVQSVLVRCAGAAISLVLLGRLGFSCGYGRRAVARTLVLPFVSIHLC
jgi:hypothetical protein